MAKKLGSQAKKLTFSAKKVMGMQAKKLTFKAAKVMGKKAKKTKGQVIEDKFGHLPIR